LKSVVFNGAGQSTIRTIVSGVNIRQFEISADGHYLATTSFHWRVHVFDIDTGSCIAKLPKLESPPIVSTFKASVAELVLFAGGECREVFVYSLENGSFHCVGRITRNLKNEYFVGRAKLSCPVSILPIPFENNLFCVYDNDSVILFRINAGIIQSSASAKRKLSHENRVSVQLVKAASLVLFVGTFCLKKANQSKHHEKGLIVVEKSQKALLDTLPRTLYRKRFGT
jgi:hypothetical protein